MKELCSVLRLNRVFLYLYIFQDLAELIIGAITQTLSSYEVKDIKSV